MNFWSSQFRANLRNTKLEILQTNEEDKLPAEHDTNNWKIIFYYLLYMRAANIIVAAKEIWLNFEATIGWSHECQRKQTGKHFEICTQQEMRNDWKLRGKRKKHSVFLKNFWGCRPTLFRLPRASKLSRPPPPLSTRVVTLVSAINCGWSLTYCKRRNLAWF